MEIWRDIPGYEGVYQASTESEVRSLDRVETYTRNGKEVTRKFKGRILKQCVNEDGYLVVSIHGTPKKVHQLIANAFPEICGTWFTGAEVDHSDGNPLNNNPLNLSYKDHKANMNNPITKERRSKVMTNRKDQSKAVVQLSMGGAFIAEFPSIREVERQTGLANQNISACCNGKQHSAGGFRWLYKSDYEKMKEEAA